MQTEIYSEQDIDVLQHRVNKFDKEHNVKFMQHSSAANDKGVTVTVVIFYEDN